VRNHGESIALESILGEIIWILYPVFWPAVMFLFFQTWHQFMNAWHDLFLNGCVSIKGLNVNTSSCSTTPCDNKEKAKQIELEKAFKAFAREIAGMHKVRVLWPAIILAMFLTNLDAAGIYKLYWHEGGKSFYMETVNKDKPECYVLLYQKLVPAVCSESKGDRLEDDWTEAWAWPGNKVDKVANGYFVLAAYTQELLLILFALMALFQIVLHLWLFWRFESIEVSRSRQLLLTLDPLSTMHEFGLEGWNYALNNTYWIISMALLIPIISVTSQPPGKADVGQILMKWIVPLLFLVPLIGTIIVRQIRVSLLWSDVRKMGEDTAEVKGFHKQVLWPFDRNWASKLGIIIAFALLTYVTGDLLKWLHI